VTDKEILIKAMAIAVRRGFELGDGFFTETPTEFYVVEGMDLYFSLVFDHGFAMAFWGEEPLYLSNSSFKTMGYLPNTPLWKFHITQMVLSENPLYYLIPFLNED